MSKFTKGLVKEVKKEHAFQQEQKQLKSKYRIQEDVVVIEKNNFARLLVTVISSIIRFLAICGIVVLAIIGIFTIIYPQIRVPFIETIFKIIIELQNYLGI